MSVGLGEGHWLEIDQMIWFLDRFPGMSSAEQLWHRPRAPNEGVWSGDQHPLAFPVALWGWNSSVGESASPPALKWGN